MEKSYKIFTTEEFNKDFEKLDDKDQRKELEKQTWDLTEYAQGSARGTGATREETSKLYTRMKKSREELDRLTGEKAEKIEVPARLAPQVSVIKGFNELFKAAVSKPKQDAKAASLKKSKDEKAKTAANKMWTVYHHFKKHHGMLNW